VALQFALRRNQRKTVTCWKDFQSARRCGSGRGTKGSARQCVPSDGWKWWTASSSHRSIAGCALDVGTQNICQFHTPHKTRNECCLHRVRLQPETVRRPLERRPRLPNPRQLMPHFARVFRRLLPMTPGSSPTVLCKNIGPAPSAVKHRKPAACFVSDPLHIRGEPHGVGANLRSNLFHCGANVVEWRQLSSVRNRPLSIRRRPNDRRRHWRT